MKALNLDLLNINSPYSVWNVGKYGYGFKTKYGVLFRIVISNFAAVIVQRDNPQLKKIFSDFDNFVRFFKDKPQ